MDNKNLEQFIQRMYDLSFSRHKSNYSEEDLKAIALETGMSESDWEASRKELLRKKQSGTRHNTHGNYTDALRDLEAARALNPFDSEVLLSLAEAYKGKADSGGKTDDYDKAEYFAQAAIDAGSRSDKSYQLLKAINNRQSLADTNRKKLLRSSVIVIGLLLVIVMIGYISVKNKVVDKEEHVKEKWAQVENVYQRRADLIPALVQTVKAAADFEKELLSELTEARSKVGGIQVNSGNLSQEQIDAFAAKQEELGGALSRLLAVSENYPELKSLSNFRDLQAQIEGSENRITVERRRFNEQVREYNSYIKKFPQSLLGFEEKGYFKADKSASEMPEIDL